MEKGKTVKKKYTPKIARRSDEIIDKIKPELEPEEEEIFIVEPGSEEEAEGVRDAKRTLRAMYMSVTLWSVLGLVLLFFVKEKVSFLLGILIGYAAAIFYVWHLNRSLIKCLDYEEKHAESAMRFDILVRLSLVAVLDIGFSAIIGGDSPLGVLYELLVMKVANYTAPSLNTFLKKKER